MSSPLQFGLRSIDFERRLPLASQVTQSQTELIRLMSWTQVQAIAANATSVNIDNVFAAEST